MWVAGSNSLQRGFTLLELMVVLVIAALALGVVTPRLFAVLPGVELKTSAQNLAAMLRLARSQSIAGGKVISVEYDNELPALRITDRPQVYSWPESIQLELQNKESLLQPVNQQQTTVLYFYPDGSSSGGTVLVASDAGEYRISVHWLTGKVSFDD
jgi:general secretion pathway protein H